MGCRPRAHTPGLLPAGRTERIVGETCVCLANARARGRTARTRSRRKRPERAHACCRPPAALRARVWHHGTDAPGGGRTHDAPRKSSAPAGSWCPRGRHAPGGAGVARGRPGARLLRPRSRSWRRWSAIWQKSFLKDPGPPGRPPQNLYGRPPGEAPNRHSSQTCFRGWPKMFEKMSGTSPGPAGLGTTTKRKRSKKE
jgi:hypothetical protein